MLTHVPHDQNLSILPSQEEEEEGTFPGRDNRFIQTCFSWDSEFGDWEGQYAKVRQAQHWLMVSRRQCAIKSFAVSLALSPLCA